MDALSEPRLTMEMHLLWTHGKDDGDKFPQNPESNWFDMKHIVLESLS